MALSNTATPIYYGRFREAVMRGEIPVCREISMEMNRIDDLIANPGVYYDDKAVNGFIKFCERELTLTDGSDLKLLDSFKLWAEEIFGWYYFVERSVYVPEPGGHGGHYERKRIKKRLITKQFDAVLDSGLNSCLNLSANKDQTGRALRYDIYLSLLDEGVITIVPVDIDEDPVTGETEIRSMRVGKVKEWYPDDVRVELYNDRTGQKEEVILPKERAAIVENPFYSVMNEPNSTVQRLISKLRIMDAVDEQAGSGKLDLIIQLPYTVKSPARKEQAQERRKTLEEQLAGSRYGIGYIDATEHITQLNRSLENNLLKSIEYLTNMAYSQLGLTPEIMNGTADDTVMTNYENRVIEPLVAAVVDELKRKFLSREDLKAKQSIMYFRDPFKLAPVSMVAEMADKFTRNEIMTSNEFRQVIGMKPSKDPKADQLLNKNLSPNAGQAAQIGSDPRRKRARGCGADGK